MMKTFLIGGLVAGSLVGAVVGIVTVFPDWRQRIGLASEPATATLPHASTVTQAPQLPSDATKADSSVNATGVPAAGNAAVGDDESAGESRLATAPANTPVESPPDMGVSPPPQGAAPEAAADPGTEEGDPDAPGVDIVRIDPEGQTVIAGTAEPGAEVEALLDGKMIGSATADESGEFVIVTDIGESDEARALQLRTARTTPEAAATYPGDAAGEPATVARSAPGATAASPENAANETDAETAEAPPGYALSAPIVILPGATDDDSPVVVEAGEADVAVVQPSSTATGRIVLDRITYSPGGDAVAAGRGRPGNAVRAYANAVFVADAPIDASGDWRIVLPREIAQAARLLRFDEVTVEGIVASRLETAFSYAEDGGPQEARRRELVVQRGDNLWRIAEQYYGEGLRYSVIFGANSTLIRDPDLIYPGQVFTIPEMVSAE